MRNLLKYLFVTISVCLILGSCVRIPDDNSQEKPENEQPNTGVTTEPFIATPLNEEEIAAKQDESMVEGHAYIHDGEKLHDLMELKYTDCGVTIDGEWPGFQEKLEEIQNQSDEFIITFTVVGYSEQFQLSEEDYSDPYSDYRLYTNLRVDEIHYMGSEVSLTEGEVYCFQHAGAWVTQEKTEYKYSLYPRKDCKYGVFRYGHQYIMTGSYYAEEDKWSISNSLGWNEICSDEEAQSFWKQYPDMAASYVTSADQLFEPGFRD